jgi:hypothetical protein
MLKGLVCGAIIRPKKGACVMKVSSLALAGLVMCGAAGAALGGVQVGEGTYNSNNVGDTTIVRGELTSVGEVIGYADNPENDDPASDDENGVFIWSSGYYYNNENPLLADWRVAFIPLYDIDHHFLGYGWTVYHLVNNQWVPDHSGQIRPV